MPITTILRTYYPVCVALGAAFSPRDSLTLRVDFGGVEYADPSRRMTVIELLRLVPPLRPLSAPQLLRMAGQVYGHTLEEGQVFRGLLLPDAPALYLRAGTLVSVLASAQPRGECPVLHAREGWVGLGQTIAQPMGGRMLRALTPCQLVAIPRDALHDAAVRNPEFAFALLEWMARENVELRHQVEEYQSLSLMGRLARALLRMAVDGEAGMVVDLPSDQTLLSQLLGCARGPLNRALHSLQDSGDIALARRQIQILNPEALQRVG